MAKITYKEVVNDPSSEIKLRCKKTHIGNFNIGPGQIKPFKYIEGEVLPRREIALIESNWELTQEFK